MVAATQLKSALDMKPEVAAKYLGAKTNLKSWKWSEVYEGEHAKAFTVAKVTQMDLLQDVRNAIQESIDKGLTFEDFKKNITPTLKEKGWWGEKEVLNPKTGKLETVQLGSPHRLETIYRTNLNTAYARGRYDSLRQSADTHPYWMYVTALDNRTRPTHRALHGKVFRNDDPFWDNFYPPNDWMCRCRVRGLSEDKLNRKGLSVEQTTNNIKTRRVYVDGIPKKQAIYTDPKTGERISPGYGWSYNVGGSAWTPDFGKYQQQDDLNSCVKELMGGLPFYRFFKNAQNKVITGALGDSSELFVVGAVDDATRNILKAETNHVFMSESDLVDHLKKHPEVGINDYRQIPSLFDDEKRLVIGQGDDRIIFIKKDNKYLYGNIKATKKRDELFFNTLFSTSKDKVDRKRKQAAAGLNDLKIIQDTLD